VLGQSLDLVSGKTVKGALIRESGNLVTGGVLSAARKTPEGAPVCLSRLAARART
jgi:hypothetical protein